MTSTSFANLSGASAHFTATAGSRCAQEVDAGCAASALHRDLGPRNTGLVQRVSNGASSFWGAGGRGLLSPPLQNEKSGGSRFQIRAIKRGGGVRRKPKDVNPMELAKQGPKMNEAVLSYPNIRLLDQDQKMIGIVASADALLAARNKDLDLVLIAGDADPPVCRIMDYTKYKYEKEKKARDSLKRSKAHRVDQKELKMRYNTDVGDYNTTLRKCMRFLRAGDKVKFSMNFKAREMGFQKQGLQLFEKVQNDIGEWGTTEGRITVEGRNILLMIGPNKPYIERVRREEAKAGKVVDDSSDDEDDEQESEVAGSDDDSDDDDVSVDVSNAVSGDVSDSVTDNVSVNGTNDVSSSVSDGDSKDVADGNGKGVVEGAGGSNGAPVPAESVPASVQ